MSLGNSMWSFMNTVTQPAQLSENQRDLSRPLSYNVNPEDPFSLMQASQRAMSRGDTLEGQQLQTQAAQIEKKKEDERINNIRKSYQAAYAKSPEAAKQFEGAMIEAGDPDVIGQIKEEEMARRVSLATGDASLDTAEGKKWFQKLMSAKTEAGQKAVEEAARAAGRGDVVGKWREAISKEKVNEIRLAASQLEQKTAQAQAQIDEMVIPNNEQELMQAMGQVPPEQRPYFMEKAKETLNFRKEVRQAFEKDPQGELSDETLAAAGWTRTMYQNVVDSGAGLKETNQKVLTAISKRPLPKEDEIKISKAQEGIIEDAIDAEFKALTWQWGEDDPGKTFGKRDVTRARAKGLTMEYMQDGVDFDTAIEWAVNGEGERDDAQAPRGEAQPITEIEDIDAAIEAKRKELEGVL